MRCAWAEESALAGQGLAWLQVGLRNSAHSNFFLLSPRLDRCAQSPHNHPHRRLCEHHGCHQEIARHQARESKGQILQ